MLVERWHEIENLYHSACERKPEERRSYLERACGGDETLLREVESLLANEDLARSFLETDPAKAAAMGPVRRADRALRRPGVSARRRNG